MQCVGFQDVKVGHVYLAPFDNEYFRARVDSVDRRAGTIAVFFIDFGNVRNDVRLSELIPITRNGLREIGPVGIKLVETPALALECSLAETRPNPHRGKVFQKVLEQKILSLSYLGGEDWDAQAIDKFNKLVRGDDNNSENQFVFTNVYAVTQGANGPLLTVTLYKSRSDADLAVNDINTKLKSDTDDKVR